MYQVFNPIQGQYTQASSLDEAKIIRSDIVAQYCVYQNLFQSIPTDQYYKDNQAYANEFLAIHTGETNTTYSYSVYNATTQEYLSQVFVYDGGMIKVDKGVVLEWYKQNGVINGVTHDFVSLDLNTEEPLDYYDWAENQVGVVMNKYDLNGQFVVSTNFTEIPEDKKPLLVDFNYPITAWSDKYYGFCIEYLEPTSIPYNDCTPEQKAQLNSEIIAYGKNNSDLFVVNQEIYNEDGSVTWTVVDTSNW